MTDPRSRSTKECSKLRTQRNQARAKLEKKLGRKLRPGEQCDHDKAKGRKKNYNNSESNLSVKTQKAHTAKGRAAKNETGGRMKGSKDTVKRKKRTTKK